MLHCITTSLSDTDHNFCILSHKQLVQAICAQFRMGDLRVMTTLIGINRTSTNGTSTHQKMGRSDREETKFQALLGGLPLTRRRIFGGIGSLLLTSFLLFSSLAYMAGNSSRNSLDTSDRWESTSLVPTHMLVSW